MFYRFLKSKLGILLAITLLALTIYYLARESYKKRLIDKEIALLEAEIASVEGNNKEILSLINYYKTAEYKDRQARSILNLQKEGEFAVALPERQPDDDGSVTGSNDSRSNLEKWWNYFFNARRQ